MVRLRKDIIIAIDGYSSCGKSTFAKKIASYLGILYIDSGAMYRAIAYYALRNDLLIDHAVNQKKITHQLSNIDIDLKHDEEGNINTFLNNKNIEQQIRSQQVSNAVSTVSQFPEVREHLVLKQREISNGKSVVMDGRDIGTVVFPNADIKIFMTASKDIRAERRFEEMKQKGSEVSYKDVLDNLSLRDENDVNRKHSPLKKADDALVLDNSHMGFEDQMDWFKKTLSEKALVYGE